MVVSSISDMESKKMLGFGMAKWMEKHENELRKWLDTNISFDDRENFIDRIFSNELLLYATHMVVKQSRTANEDKIASILQELNDRTGLIYLIVGSKRSGKTSLLHILGENLKKRYGREVWWYGPPAVIPKYMDGHTMDMDRIPPGSLVLIDEASVLFFSRVRDEMSTDFIRRLPVIAHADKNYIFCSQSSAITDLNIARLADAIIFKTYSVLQQGTERFSVSDQLQFFMPNKVNEALYFDNSKIMTFTYPLPPWWTDTYSKPYAPFRTPAEYYRFVLYLIRDGIPLKKVIEVVGMRGRKIEQIEAEEIRMIANHYGMDYLLNLPDVQMSELIESGFDDTPLLEQLKGNFMKIKGNFELAPMNKESDERRKIDSVEYSLMTKKNINQLFISHVKFRFSHKANMILSVIGQTGTGKSYASIALGLVFSHLLNSAFTHRNIEFDINRIIDMLAEVKTRNTLIMDEQAEEFGAGSGRTKMEMRNVEETFRKRQVNFIYNSPTLRTHSHQFVLETYGIDYKRQIARLLVYQTYPGIPLGYITLGLPPKSILSGYEKKKDEFLKMVEERKSSLQKYKNKIVKELLEDDKYLSLRTNQLRTTYIRKLHPNITVSEAEEIRNLAEIERL